MNMREQLAEQGIALAQEFCALNRLKPPMFNRISKGHPFYGLGTCAFYRPATINYMVEKCANPGMGGRCWSWPAYCIDRTPYGVIQHELGHHVDSLLSVFSGSLFSQKLHEKAESEEPLTKYLGTDNRQSTFYQEWFAENFRLFVTNPALSAILRPKFFKALVSVDFGMISIARFMVQGYLERLVEMKATDRIILQANKKAQTKANSQEFLTYV